MGDPNLIIRPMRLNGKAGSRFDDVRGRGMNDFRLAMVSAGFEHGGNVTHRHFDGHPDLLVYPFESQLGNRNFNDFLASVERVHYRYP